MITPALLLISLSVVVIYTSDPKLSMQQAAFSIIGIIGYFIIKNFNFKFLTSFIIPTYCFVSILLVIVLILGIETRGAIRWINVGPFNLQPSEFAKIVLILSLAKFWAVRLPTWKNILSSLAILAPIFILIFLQPDLGTVLTICFIWVSMLFASNISILKLSLMGIIGLIATPMGWQLLHGYQKLRINSYFYPSKDPLGVGYNVIQSTIAIGSGEILGRGLGRGTQSRLQFLPEFRTDFIFAFIAEELGLIGSFLIIVLFLLILVICFKVFSDTESRFGELIVAGVMSMLFFQIVVNIGMNIGVLPVTGIPLPLLSYGGSSMVATLISLGLVSSVGKFARRDTHKGIIEFG